MGITSTFVGGVSSVMNSLPKHSKPSKLISMRILFATLCLTLIIIGGCSTQRGNLSPSERVEVFKSFERGEIRQNCGTSCAMLFGYARRDLRKAHDQGAWRELASRNLEIGFHGWLSYYYLGRAAEGLGKYKAAKIYYEFAKSDAYKSGSYNLNGFTFPRDIDHRLMVLAGQKNDDWEKEGITQKHTQSQSKPDGVSWGERLSNALHKGAETQRQRNQRARDALSNPINTSPSAVPNNFNRRCTSKFDCSYGMTCVKKPAPSLGKKRSYELYGVCMQGVDRGGMEVRNPSNRIDITRPRLKEPNDRIARCGIGIGKKSCPVGFRCDYHYEVCVKY